MKTRFVAATIEEAQQVFGRRFYEDSLPNTQPELDERVKLGAFLRVYARSARCAFPIVVDISPRDERPDFKVTFGKTGVGIEASKIANSELEEMRSIQRQQKLGTIEISSLLQPQGKKGLKQRIADCTGMIGPLIFPDPDQMGRQNAFWLKQARCIILRKHAITKQLTFNRYGQTWLLLLDRLSYKDELKQRVETLADWLRPRWDSGLFERIIIQQQHSERFFMLSQKGVEILQKEAVFPVAEFSLPDTLSLPTE